MHKIEREKTLFIFIDESGNFDFSPRGTSFFTLTGVTTFSPELSHQPFYSIKYDVMKNGLDQEMFRATEDRQCVRDKVFKQIELSQYFDVHTVVANKRGIDPRYRTEELFYKHIATALLSQIRITHQSFRDVEIIIIVLGALFTNKKRRYILKCLKAYLKRTVQKPFVVYFLQ